MKTILRSGAQLTRSPKKSGRFTRLVLIRFTMSLWRHLVGLRYRSVVHLKEILQTYSGERLSHISAWMKIVRLILAPRKTILCYPTRPSPRSVLLKLCTLSGYWITRNPKKACDAVFRWDDATWSRLDWMPYEAAALNLRCTDISKRYISNVFAEVFGYDLLVNPTEYAGLMVKKSDENYTHDGEVIEGPVAAKLVASGFVYQKAIDNRSPEGLEFYEYRVPIIGHSIPILYVKYRPLDGQFTEFSRVDVVSPEKVLSVEERGLLLAFAATIGMDYGELDVLRDRTDRRIYVVDANNTPSGPVRGFRIEQSAEALRALRPSFEALVAESGRRMKGLSLRSDEQVPRDQSILIPG